MKRYTISELAYMVDHTNLHPDATRKDMEKLCHEAVTYGFHMVAVNSVQSKLCSTLLARMSIRALPSPSRSARPRLPRRSSRRRMPLQMARTRSTMS